MLELAILGLLKEQDLHGYELKKRLADTLGVVSGVSFGSLYPALGRLERAGAVHTIEPVVGDETEAAADHEGQARRPRAGRSRKVYGITSQGDVLFDELLAAETASVDDGRMFHLRLAFARYLPAEARIGMLERRRAHLLDLLTRAGSRPRTGRRIDGYVRSLMEHDRESAEHDLSWIERLIARERGGAPADPADGVGGPEAVPSAAVPSAAVPSVAAQSAASASRPVPLLSAAPTLSGLWRTRGSRTAPISGPEAPSNQEESTA